jgi:hypothetical protein
MSKVFLDDSSDDNRMRTIAYGGLIGRDANWLKFDSNWTDATADIRGKAGSSDLETGRGAFNGWSHKRRHSRYAALIDLIGSSRLFGFGTSIPVSDYQAVFGSRANPFDLAVAHCGVLSLNMAAIWKDPLKMWFDSSSATSSGRYKFKDAISGHPLSEHISTFSVCTLPVAGSESADFVARECFKYHDNVGMRAERKSVLSLYGKVNFTIWDRLALEKMKEFGWPEDFSAVVDCKLGVRDFIYPDAP